MQIKFNFNNFIFYGVSATAWQRASGIRRRRWRLWLAYPIMTSFRYVPHVPYVSSVTFLTFLSPYVSYVVCVACVAMDGNPALGVYKATQLN